MMTTPARKGVDMAVITISREIGSDGTEVGRLLADVLGYRYADKSVIETILREYGFAEFERVYDTSPSFWDRFDETTSLTIDMLQRVQQALAAHGDVVLVGRGGFAVLAGFADVVHIRVQAPFSIRARRIMQLEGITDLSDAESYVRHNDAVRASFVETHHSVRWDDARAFHLVVDTSRFPVEIAVPLLARAIERLDKAEVSGPRVIDAVAIDPVLAEYVSQVLEGAPA